MDRRLTTAGVRHRMRQAGSVVARVVRPFGRRAPERLIIAPQDLRTTDSTIADDIYAGQIKLAGKLLETHGRSPFELPPPSDAFAAELHGFGWLRHLRAAETPLARANSRALVADWISATRRGLPAVAARPEVSSRRLISWLSQSPLLLDGADGDFYRAFVKAASREAMRIERSIPAQPPGELQLMMRIALMHYGLAALEDDKTIRHAAERLCALLDEQILPDGGHASRNPGVVLQVLLDLLPLKLAFISRRIQTPRPVLSAIDRMTPMLRMMRHADGAMALFNGMGPTRMDAVASVLALDDVLAPAPSNAPYSGYQRIEAGASVLLVDAGPPPLPPLANRAHAAPGAFELSVENTRLVVNCGAPPPNRQDLLRLGRLTAAHSTLVVGDESIGRFGRSRLGGETFGEQYVSGASDVSVQREDRPEGTSIAVEHNGYARRFKLRHSRILQLAQDGQRLAGEDSLRPTRGAMPDKPYDLRFHLHPLVKAVVSEDGRLIWLQLANQSVWMFEAGGLPVAVEESVFFASSEGARRTTQIVVSATTAAAPKIAWSFERHQKS